MKNSDRATLKLPEKMPSRITSVQEKATSATFSIGEEIGGYRITSVIAENTGEASVLLGEKDGEKRVVKLFHKDRKPKGNIVTKIMQTNSPHIIKFYDSGESGGRFYIIMSYCKSGDLTSRLPISAEELRSVVVPCVLDGLKELHGKGVIHRDIKPSNLFFSDDMKSVIIGDFGISSELDNQNSVRATGMSRTLGYAAPESSAGFISEKSDFYSFGITLLQLITGHDIFAGMTEMQIIYQTLNKSIPIPRTVPRDIAVLIRGLTGKDRVKRWGEEEVRRWLRGDYRDDTDDTEDNNKRGSLKEGFTFEYEVYGDLKTLAAAMAKKWNKAKDYLPELNTRLGSYNSMLSHEVAALQSLSNADVALFRTLLALDDEAPIYYNGEVYASPESIGILMVKKLPEIDENVISLVKSGCLTYYLKKRCYDEKLIKRLEYIAAQLVLGKSEFYFALLYFLNPKHAYSDKFGSMDELVDYLEGLSDSERDSVARELVYDKSFLMWIFSRGYQKQLNEWIVFCKEGEWE